MATEVRFRGQPAPLWGAVPPPPRVKKYEKLRVCSTQPVELAILNDQLEETFTHFTDKRTVFCSGPESGCWLDHALVGKPRYGAWLAVQQSHIRVCYLLRLTAVAVHVDNRLKLLSGSLRGRLIQVWRLSNYEGAEMHVKVLDQVIDPAKLLPSPDVRYCVERMVAAEDRANNPGKGKWQPMKDAAAAAAGRHPQLK